MEKYWKISPSTYLKRVIDLNYNEQKAGDIACLDNQSCVVKFKTGVQVINLSPNSPSENRSFDFYSHKIFYCKIFPSKGGIFSLFDGKNIHLVNSKSEIKRFEDCHSFVYFNHSGEIWNFKKKQCRRLSQQPMISQSQYVQKITKSADSDQHIVSNINNDLISILNLNTGNIIQLNIPQQFYTPSDKARHNVYLINKKQALFGYQTNKSQEFNLCIINFVENKHQKLKQFQGKGEFVCLNKELGFLVFKLYCSKVKTLIVIYNYNERSTVWQHRIPQFHYERPSLSLYLEDHVEISKRFSPDLKHYVQLERINCQTKLIHYKQVSFKKLYFHLLQKSGTFKKFGNSLAIHVFRAFMV